MKPLTAVVAAALLVSSCATSSSFELTVPPATQPKRFTAVDVAPVTSDWVPENESAVAEMGSAIRRAIIDELTGSGEFALVVSELDPAPGAVLIACSIVDFVEGSRLARYLVGFGAGKAELKVACRFTDLTNDEPYAEAVFSGELKGGFLGGDAGAATMGKEVAEAIGRFLRTGLSE